MQQLKEYLTDAISSIRKTDITFSLHGYEFTLYEVNDIDNIKKEELPEVAGLYCFTKRLHRTEIVQHRFRHSHTLIYLGMTKDFPDRIPNHNKIEEIKKHQPTHMALCRINGKTWDEIKEIESQILKEFFFTENTQENKEKGERQNYIIEN